jgi:Virulence factor
MATLTIISWRDIPAQVVGKRGRETAKIQLSPRFQEAVDRAAMRAGKGSSDAYLADWKRSEPQPCADDIRTVVAATAAEIEARYTDEDLERLIRAKGLAGQPSASAAESAPTAQAAPATHAPSATRAAQSPQAAADADPADPSGA